MFLPKLKPYVAISALLAMMIATEVTTLNIHEAISSAAFLSALPTGAIFLLLNFYIFPFTSYISAFCALDGLFAPTEDVEHYISLHGKQQANNQLKTSTSKNCRKMQT